MCSSDLIDRRQIRREFRALHAKSLGQIHARHVEITFASCNEEEVVPESRIFDGEGEANARCCAGDDGARSMTHDRDDVERSSHHAWVPLEMRSGSSTRATGPSVIRFASKITHSLLSALTSMV